MLSPAAYTFFRIKQIFVISVYTFKLVCDEKVVAHCPGLIRNSRLWGRLGGSLG